MKTVQKRSKLLSIDDIFNLNFISSSLISLSRCVEDFLNTRTATRAMFESRNKEPSNAIVRYMEFFLCRADERTQQALCFNGHTNLIVLPRPDMQRNTEKERERELCSDAKRTSGGLRVRQIVTKTCSPTGRS